MCPLKTQINQHSIEIKRKIKSASYSRYYDEEWNERRVHVRGLASGRYSSQDTSQRWQPVGETVSDLTGRGIDTRPKTPLSDWTRSESSLRLIGKLLVFIVSFRN